MAISYKVVHQLRANKLRQLEQNKFLFFELQKFEKLIYGLKINTLPEKVFHYICLI